MKSVNIKAFGLVLAFAAFAFVGFGQGCGDFKLAQMGSGEGGSLGVSGADDKPDFPVIPGAKTITTVYSNQVLDQMAACTNLKQPSAITMQTYQERKGSLNEYGYAAAVTAPMMMSIVTIAGEVCNDVIEQEKTTPNIFSGVNFGAGPTFSTMRDAASRLALNCWQREATATELETLAASFDDITNVARMEASDPARNKSPTALTRDGALALCTTMLSSLGAITY